MGMVLMIGFGLLLIAAVQNPEVTTVVSTLLALAIGWHFFKPVRRMLRWYVFWPIGRLNYRLIKRPVRLILGGIMAKWKMKVVADELDETLMKLCYEAHIISPEQYRRISNTVGKALGMSDLVTRKLHKEGVKRRVQMNVEESAKAGPKAALPGPPPGCTVDTSYDPKSGKVTNLSYLRTRNSAA
jgi:hypothetical protein